MGNSVSTNSVHQNREHPRAITGVNRANATSAQASPPSTATGQSAANIAAELNTGLQQASQASQVSPSAKPISLPHLIATAGPHLLNKYSAPALLNLLRACNQDLSLRNQHAFVQLDYLAENGNCAALPTAQKLQTDLAFFSKTHPDKSISRHALGLILQLATQNTPQNTPPGSVAHPRHRLAQLAVATLEHLNDGDIQNINIKTQMTPEQLQQVIDLLSNLPPEHLDGAQQAKIATFVSYLTNKQTHIRAAQNDPFHLLHANTPEAVRGDYDVVLVAVGQGALGRRGLHSLAYASAELRNNFDIVMAAVRRDGEALQHASAALQNDPAIVMAAVQRNPEALRYTREAFRNDFGIVMEAVRRDGGVLRYAGDALQNNFDIVMAAVRQNGGALRHASAALKGDPAIVMAAVQRNPRALRYASAALQNDPDMRRAAELL